MPFSFSIKVPAAGPYQSDIFINNAGGYPKAEGGAMTTDGLDARNTFYVGALVYAKDKNSRSDPLRVLGRCTAVTATSVRIGAGTGFAVSDNDELYCEDTAARAYALAVPLAAGASFILAPSTTIEVSDDGRGNMMVTYTDFA